MKAKPETNQLIKELSELRQRIAELEASEGELERVKQQLQKREATFTEAQRIAHVGNWEWDIRNNTVCWSDELCRIFGLEPEEFGSTYEAVLDRVHPDDRERVEKTIAKSLRVKKGYSIEHRIVRPDGSLRVIQAHAEAILGEDGQPSKMAGTVLDITECKGTEEALRASEEKYKALVENASDFIYTFYSIMVVSQFP